MPASLATTTNPENRKQALAERPASFSFSIGTETADARTIVIQLLDGNGGPCPGKRIVDVTVWATTGQAALSGGGSTGLAAGSGTVLVATLVAKTNLRFLSDANGKVTLTWTDTGTATAAIEASCDGARSMSAQFANA